MTNEEAQLLKAGDKVILERLDDYPCNEVNAAKAYNLKIGSEYTISAPSWGFFENDKGRCEGGFQLDEVSGLDGPFFVPAAFKVV